MGHYTKPCSSLKSSPTWVLPNLSVCLQVVCHFPILNLTNINPMFQKYIAFYRTSITFWVFTRTMLVIIYIVVLKLLKLFILFVKIKFSVGLTKAIREIIKKKGIIEILNRQCMQYYKMRLRAVCVLNCYKLADCLFTCSPGRCSGQSKI